MLSGDVLRLLPSSTTLSSMAVYSTCRRDVCAIVSTSWRDLFTEVCRELLIEEVIGRDLDRASLYYVSIWYVCTFSCLVHLC